MTQRTNRTFICSVLFLDIVEYSRIPVEEQIQLKERFNAILSEAIQDIAVNDRIILDTGDGAAISFLGDPEDALFVAMEVRDMVTDSPVDAAPRLSIRMGINLGPVKLITDINKQQNLIGDGINVAQRVMNFAQPGQLLVSRSYYEVISCLSQEYAKLFNYQGLHSDKHIREHEVYAVGHQEVRQKPNLHGRARQQNIAVCTEEAIAGEPDPSEQGRSVRRETTETDASHLAPAAARLRPARKKWMYALIPLVVAAVVIVIYWMPSGKSPSQSDKASDETAAISKPKTAPKAASAAKSVKEGPPAPPENAGGQLSSVQFRILPWGEIYVNGRKRGVSPPLNSIQLKPGKYTIEVKNSSFDVHTQSVELKANDRIQVHHTFK